MQRFSKSDNPNKKVNIELRQEDFENYDEYLKAYRKEYYHKRYLRVKEEETDEEKEKRLAQSRETSKKHYETYKEFGRTPALKKAQKKYYEKNKRELLEKQRERYAKSKIEKEQMKKEIDLLNEILDIKNE